MKRVHHHPATHSHPSNATVQVSQGQTTVVVNPNPPHFPGQLPMYHPNSFLQLIIIHPITHPRINIITNNQHPILINTHKWW